MDHEEMKLKCLEMVMAKWPNLAPEQARDEALKMYNFTRGRQLDDRGGEVVSYRAPPPNKIETDKATIYRKPPFDTEDYKPE